MTDVHQIRGAILEFTMLVCLIEYGTSECSYEVSYWLPSYGYLDRSMLASTRLCNNYFKINSLQTPWMCHRNVFVRMSDIQDGVETDASIGLF